MSETSGPERKSAGRGGGPERKKEEQRRNPAGVPEGASAGWSILSYMLGGMALYGALGWLIGRWTGIAVLFPVGMLVGLGLAITLIILRYGRH
jgi:ATP synthase protein I